MSEKKNLREIKDKVKKDLFRIPGVHGIAIGIKMQGDTLIPEMCIQIFVHRKKKSSELPSDQLIPSEVYGVKTDVIQSGPVELLLDESDCPEINPDPGSYRPLRGGVQIQARGGGRGTLTCVVRTRDNPPRDVMLTNEHVLYSGTATGPSCSGCTAGSGVGQPIWSGPNELGNVLKGKSSLLVDGSIATLDAGTQWRAEIEDIGPIAGTENVTYEMLESRILSGGGFYPVKKRGAKTRLTHGVIISVDFEEPPTGSRTHREQVDQQIQIYPVGHETGNVCFLASRDSGSAVVNEDNKIVGLLYGSTPITIISTGIEFRAGAASPIGSVLDELQVDMVFGHPAGHTFTVPELSAVSVSPVTERVASPAPAEMSVEEHILLRERVQNDIAQIPGGPVYVSLFKHHEDEVRTLVNTNRRVATLWHRNGGPVLLHHLIRAAQFPERKLPDAISNQTWSDCILKISKVFKKYGSDPLQKDIDRGKDLFASLGGRTYSQILERFEAGLT